MPTATLSLLFAALLSVAPVSASNIFVYSNSSDIGNDPTDLILPKPPICSDEAKSERCEWVSSEPARAVLYRDLKNSNKNWDKCDLSCGRCCEDEPIKSKLSFTINGNARKCDWLSKKTERAQKHCKKSPVYVLCPKTCGVCCEDDYSYKLVLKTGQVTKNKCSFITKKRQKKFCKGPKNRKNAVNCRGSCGCKNLSGRKQVPQMRDRFPCETKIKELRATLNPILLQGVTDDYSDSCKGKSSSEESGWRERQLNCNYKDLVKNADKKCNKVGGILYELTGSGVCTKSDGKPTETMNLLTETTSYFGIQMCIPPKCDVQEITKGLMKHERFSRGCGLTDLYLLNTEQPTPTPTTSLSGEPTPSVSGGSDEPTPSVSGGSGEPTVSGGSSEPTPAGSSSGPTPVSSSLGPT